MAYKAFGYETPQREGSDGDLEEDDNNEYSEKMSYQQQQPYGDPQGRLPYQIAQNMYQQHLFTGRPVPQEYFGPYPRAPGRPDMGHYTQNPLGVPYPQEPDRRLHRDHGYIPPPEIGFDPYKEPEPKKPHLGWILLLRYNRRGDDQVRTALTMTKRHLSDKKGELLGVARDSLRVREGGKSWLANGRMTKVGGTWDVQRDPLHELCPYNIIVIRFDSLFNAVQWLDSDRDFKQKDFPNYHTLDVMAFPEYESFEGKTGAYDTIILTEYPHIRDAQFFREMFALPTEKLMKETYHGCPYVVRSIVGYNDTAVKTRQAVPLRGSWIQRNSIVTMSFMPNAKATDDYFRDREFLNCQHFQSKVANPTTVTFTLEPPESSREQRFTKFIPRF